MTPAATDVVVTHHGDYHRIEFTGRPPVLSRALLVSVLDELDAAERDSSCRAVVLAASGRDFCTGMPFGRQAEEGWGDGTEDVCWRVFQRLTTTTVATIGAVDGPAVGGGVALAGACDLVVAGRSARFRLPELMLGLVPAMALPVIARRIGDQAAFRLAMTATEIGSAAAAELGLVDINAETADEALRAALVALKRVDPEALALLKSIRRELRPLTEVTGERAATLLRSRLTSQSVRDRITLFRQEGLLP